MVYSPKSCVYGSCESRQSVRTKLVPGAPGVFFIKFPSPITQSEKCSRWVNACGRTDFSKNDVKRSSYVCSLHFEGFSGPTPLNPDPIQNNFTLKLPVSISNFYSIWLFEKMFITRYNGSLVFLGCNQPGVRE